MNRELVTNSAGPHQGKSSSMTAPASNRGSTLMKSGQGLISGNPNQATNSNMEQRGNASHLRNSMNGNNGNRNKFSYHQSKPAQQTEKVGEYVTKEVRENQARQVKASHFQLGYAAQDQVIDGRKIDKEAERQKWNPQQELSKKDLAKSNWSFGGSKAAAPISQNKHDFLNHGASYDASAKAKRQELVQELRRSNLPSQNYNFPKSTAQDSFVQAKSKQEEADAIKKRKEEADMIFARVRPNKPNFSLGSHKMDYMSENKGSMTQPGASTIDKVGIEQHKAAQRKHNFQMSFEQGNQFETAKGQDQPYKIPKGDATKDRISKKGASNVHQVQISHNNKANDYKSLTALQQNGYHKPGESSRNTTKSYTEVRNQIAKQTADLRSSHFALGGDKSAPQASSAIMYQAPPQGALLGSGADEQRAQRERIQRSNFALADGHGQKGPAKTQSQVNNQIRQGQWTSGQITMAQQVSKPADSINFGQACQYTSETKQTFVPQALTSENRKEPARLRDKFAKPNINFGASPNKETMMTVAQANEKANSNAFRMGAPSVQASMANAAEFGTAMRAANFKMGSILPEHNNYKVTGLSKGQGSGSIGLTKNSSNFKPAVRPNQSQAVSAGNNVAKGSGSFKTVNQEFTNWIQPSAVAK